jgi:hypothetical protein
VPANRQLTIVLGAILLVLLAIEGFTLVAMRPLLPVHVFVGMLLVPVIALKLGAVLWRFARYYLRAPAYVAAGPPVLLLRVLGPLVVLTTLGLFGSGVALVVLGPRDHWLVGVHKVSFILWFGAMAIHVLGHLGTVGRALWRPERVRGVRMRVAAVALSVVAGLAVAVPTLHLERAWRHDHRHEAKGFDR